MFEINVGDIVIHKTLGKVVVLELDYEFLDEPDASNIKVEVLEEPDSEYWMDDDGYEHDTNDIGYTWWVHFNSLSNLTPKLTGKAAIAARIMKLWNESNYVKANPLQAYKEVPAL